LNKLQLAQPPLRKPKLLELLKPLWPLAMATMLIACGQVVEAHNAVHARDAAMEAATAKMIIIQGNDITGHSQYLALGKVHGHCLTGAADEIIASCDNLKEAAYRKYGSSVNAVVHESAVHINDDYTPEAPPDSTVGY
jgi:hypothetical protein